MTCRDVREALDALLDGELEAGEELSVREHLDWCRTCARDLDDFREWHGALADALSTEVVRPTTTERRRTADAVIAAIRVRGIPSARLAALMAIGLSLGIVAGAVALSRSPREQVVRVVERILERQTRDAELRAVSEEIEEDLDEARKVVAGRGSEDPAASAVAIGSLNIARRMGSDPIEELRKDPEVARVIHDVQKQNPAPAACVSITRSVNGATISVTQRSDGRIRVDVPGYGFEVRNMEELLTDHADLCRRYAIAGGDGLLAVGDTATAADWKGRLPLLLRTGAWDEHAQWEAYRVWAAARARDPKEIERKLARFQERCRTAASRKEAAVAPVDAEAVLREVQSLTRSELRKAQDRIDAEMKKLDARLREAAELKERARALRIFAEDARQD
jgi:hypothetical protein